MTGYSPNDYPKNGSELREIERQQKMKRWILRILLWPAILLSSFAAYLWTVQLLGLHEEASQLIVGLIWGTIAWNMMKAV